MLENDSVTHRSRSSTVSMVTIIAGGIIYQIVTPTAGKDHELWIVCNYKYMCVVFDTVIWWVMTDGSNTGMRS